MGVGRSKPQQKYEKDITNAVTKAVVDTINSANSSYIQNQSFQSFCGQAVSNEMAVRAIDFGVIPMLDLNFEMFNLSAKEYLDSASELVSHAAPCHMENIDLTQTFIVSQKSQQLVGSWIDGSGDTKMLENNIATNVTKATDSNGPTVKEYQTTLTNKTVDAMTQIQNAFADAGTTGQTLTIGEVGTVKMITMNQVLCKVGDVLQASKGVQDVATEWSNAITSGTTSNYNGLMGQILNFSRTVMIGEGVLAILALVVVWLTRKK